MKIKTLIVEDDPMVSKINESYLNNIESFELIGISRNGDEAWNALKQKQPHLLLLDIYMPQQNGLELLRQIRLHNLNVDAILITAADSTDVIEEAMRLGVVDYILKPFDFERFQHALFLYKRRFLLFHSTKTVDQSGLDTLQIGSEHKEAPIPKGIDKITLQLIRNTLKKSNTPLSIKEISNMIDISELTIRKYLEFLIEGEEIQLQLQYKKRGRPLKLYKYKMG